MDPNGDRPQDSSPQDSTSRLWREMSYDRPCRLLLEDRLFLGMEVEGPLYRRGRPRGFYRRPEQEIRRRLSNRGPFLLLPSPYRQDLSRALDESST